MTDSNQPYVSAGKHLPELTFKSIVLGILLAAVLGASNAYLGMKIGQTISASIPAAVISMAILGLFRHANILENNIVQTIASAGEVIAAATIFTMPALLVLGYWTTFSYAEVTLILGIGGLIGVLFSTPLRRALIVEEKLAFPEGVATAEVLKAASNKKGAASLLIKGGGWAALIQFGQSGLHLLGSSISFWTHQVSTVMGVTVGLSPVMVGAGYIIGLRVALTLLTGALLLYGIAIPWAGLTMGVPEAGSALDAAMALKGQLRYIGVGALVAGGISALLAILKPIRFAISRSFAALKDRTGAPPADRLEKDIPFPYVLLGLLLLFVPVYFLIQYFFQSLSICLTPTACLTVTLVALLLTFVLGFLVAGIGGYMAGLVGASCAPISGVLIASVILIAGLFLLLVGHEIDFSTDSVAAMSLGAGIIVMVSLIGCTSVLSCDNLQDLKAGQLLGATPWKQQVALGVGVLASALVMAPILQILLDAYGIAGVFPREGMDPAHGLAAPQAVLIATVTKGMIGADVPLNFLLMGAAIGVVASLVDGYMKKRGHGRFPPLAVALGMYLPMEVTTALSIGGILSHWVAKRKPASDEGHTHRGILFASGMIAGESLMGIVLAIPFAAFQNTHLFAYTPQGVAPYTSLFGLLAMGFLVHRLYRAAMTTRG